MKINTVKCIEIKMESNVVLFKIIIRYLLQDIYAKIDTEKPGKTCRNKVKLLHGSRRISLYTSMIAVD